MPRPFVRLRRAVALSAGMVVAVGAALAGVTPASAATTWRAPIASSSLDAVLTGRIQCADVLFIGARGSDEKDADGRSATFGATVQNARNFIEQGMESTGSRVSVRQVYVDYTAFSVDVLRDDLLHGRYSAAKKSQYFEGAETGFKSASKVLEASLYNCPAERWIAVGYSQGALITDSLARKFDRPDRWVGLYSVANTANFAGRRVMTAGSAFDGQKPKGVYTWLYKAKVDLPADLRSRSTTYCMKYDGMCDFSVLKFAAAVQAGFDIHGGYAKGSLLRSSAFSLGKQAAERMPASTRRAFSPLNVPIPAMCQHGPSRLVNGSADFGEGRGGASLVPRPGSTSASTDPFVAKQQDQSAVAIGIAAAVPIWCTAGGVGWPETIAVYSLRGDLLASVDLGRLAQQEHAAVTSLAVDGNVLTARWDAYDGAGFNTHHQSATFTRTGGKLVVSRFRDGV